MLVYQRVGVGIKHKSTFKELKIFENYGSRPSNLSNATDIACVPQCRFQGGQFGFDSCWWYEVPTFCLWDVSQIFTPDHPCPHRGNDEGDPVHGIGKANVLLLDDPTIDICWYFTDRRFDDCNRTATQNTTVWFSLSPPSGFTRNIATNHTWLMLSTSRIWY